MGAELSLRRGGWGASASLGVRGRRLRQGAEPNSELLEASVCASGGVPEAGSAGGGGARPLFWAAGSVEERRGLGQPGCGEAAALGLEEPAAAALGRRTRRRGRRTRGVTSQGSPHWNLIFICPGFTLLFFFSP